MDRFIRQPVNGTWAHREKPPPDERAVAHGKDPRGWTTHHAGYQHAGIEPLTEVQYLEAVRMRAYEIFVDRQRTGRNGTADQDWATAERQIRAAYGPPDNQR